MKKPMNFSSTDKYKKWVAYAHIHGYAQKSPGNTPIKINGKTKKVNHGK